MTMPRLLTACSRTQRRSSRDGSPTTGRSSTHSAASCPANRSWFDERPSRRIYRHARREGARRGLFHSTVTTSNTPRAIGDEIATSTPIVLAAMRAS